MSNINGVRVVLRQVFLVGFIAPVSWWTPTALSQDVLVAEIASATAIWEGVYTEAQAERGRQYYEKYCYRCHGTDMGGGGSGGDGNTPSLLGTGFQSRWSNKTLDHLLDLLIVTMPPVYSEAVEPEWKVDILARILQVNGFPTGTTELTIDDDAVDRIVFTRRRGELHPPRNFEFVQAVGCLTPAEAGPRKLMEASAPALIFHNRPANEDERQFALRQPTGENAYTLYGVRHDATLRETAQKVVVRGIMYAASDDEKRISVTWLDSLGSNECVADGARVALK